MNTYVVSRQVSGRSSAEKTERYFLIPGNIQTQARTGSLIEEPSDELKNIAFDYGSTPSVVIGNLEFEPEGSTFQPIKPCRIKSWEVVSE